MGNCNSSPPETKTQPVAGSPEKEPSKVAEPEPSLTPNVSLAAPVEPPAEEILKAETVKKARTAAEEEKAQKEIGSTSDANATDEPTTAPEKLVPDSKTGFLDDYTFGSDLGSGSFSVVKQVGTLKPLSRELSGAGLGDICVEKSYWLLVRADRMCSPNFLLPLLPQLTPPSSIPTCPGYLQKNWGSFCCQVHQEKFAPSG